MKHLTALVAGAAIALSAMTATAGVVIEQDQTSNRGSKDITQHQTIMVQGNKERLETPSHIVITDLDKGKLYILQPAAKSYLQMDFPPKGPMAQMMANKSQNAMNFTKMGSTRSVAGFKCADYKGEGKVMSGDYTITECFSTSAPGARDFSAFQDAMKEKFKGTPMAGMEGNIPGGIPLASDSTMKMNKISIPGLPPEQAKKIEEAMAKRPPVVTKTTVTKVTSQKLAESTFEVPSDYKERQMPGRTGTGPGMGMMMKPGASGAAAGAPITPAASAAASPAAH
ncbi:MAG TPA: DUF4412 domain-containing protein [Candidatus Binataceae bacterium]|nr:DUF4412 domain-containing protein [Candidatus Binataceae bacterium]